MRVICNILRCCFIMEVIIPYFLKVLTIRIIEFIIEALIYFIINLFFKSLIKRSIYIYPLVIPHAGFSQNLILICFIKVIY